MPGKPLHMTAIITTIMKTATKKRKGPEEIVEGPYSGRVARDLGNTTEAENGRIPEYSTGKDGNKEHSAENSANMKVCGGGN